VATKNSKKANDFLSFSRILHWNDENLQSLAVGEVNEICTRKAIPVVETPPLEGDLG